MFEVTPRVVIATCPHCDRLGVITHGTFGTKTKCIMRKYVHIEYIVDSGIQSLLTDHITPTLSKIQDQKRRLIISSLQVGVT